MIAGHGSTSRTPEAREGEQACRLPLGTTRETFGGLPLSMGHGSTGRTPEAREGGQEACWLPLGTTRETFGGLPLSIRAQGLSMGHGSTSHAPLTRVNGAHKPMGHVTPVYFRVSNATEEEILPGSNFRLFLSTRILVCGKSH